MEDKTDLYDISSVKKKQISLALSEICKALKERGYNPVNQIVGYLISGDPGYISSYKDCRNKILEYDRAEIVAIILEDYLNK
jgi:uncharacterized protein (UPF0297 family)